jgi:2-phospho-L-lactate guanylyltransferase
MKDPKCSKQRLAGVLIPKEREILALNLFRNTLDFLRRHFPSTPVIVVTPSHIIATIARRYNAQAVLEPDSTNLNATDLKSSNIKSANLKSTGLNYAVNHGAKACMALGYSAQLLIPADIVDLDVAEFKQLINSPRDARSVTLCPSRDGGTNALLSSPPDVIDFQFGKNSSVHHLNSAKAQKVQWRELKLAKMALDLDTAEDLVQLDSAVISQLKQSSTAITEQLRGVM